VVAGKPKPVVNDPGHLSADAFVGGLSTPVLVAPSTGTPRQAVSIIGRCAKSRLRCAERNPYLCAKWPVPGKDRREGGLARNATLEGRKRRKGGLNVSGSYPPYLNAFAGAGGGGRTFRFVFLFLL
jgi:hypothetical protein